MKRACHQVLKAQVSQVLKPIEGQSEEQRLVQSYRAPQLFVVGKAVDLVQGYSYGKYSDGYTGYYWER